MPWPKPRLCLHVKSVGWHPTFPRRIIYGQPCEFSLSSQLRDDRNTKPAPRIRWLALASAPAGGGDRAASSTMLPFGGSVALFLAELSPATLYRSKGQGRPLSELRKLAAIFAADVVGFSRLAGARLLSRLTRKSWEALGLAEGVSVYAQVKAVALAPGRGD